MEVHAHTHTPRKKWTHYLWEFLMLFLAVFCGFLAELQLEHYVESQREKKFAGRLLSDLKQDTAIYHRFSIKVADELARYDSISLVFKQNPGITDDEFVRLVRRLYAAYSFFNIPTTFNQMKYSGSIRYMKNDSLVSNLTDYYDQLIPRLSTLFDYINEKLHTEIEPFFAGHFDLNLTHFYWDTKLPGGLKYYNRSENSDLLIKNYFQLYYNGISIVYDRLLKKVNDDAIKLIKVLENEYHLK